MKIRDDLLNKLKDTILSKESALLTKRNEKFAVFKKKANKGRRALYSPTFF